MMNIWRILGTLLFILHGVWCEIAGVVLLKLEVTD